MFAFQGGLELISRGNNSVSAEVVPITNRSAEADFIEFCAQESSQPSQRETLCRLPGTEPCWRRRLRR